MLADSAYNACYLIRLTLRPFLVLHLECYLQTLATNGPSRSQLTARSSPQVGRPSLIHSGEKDVQILLSHCRSHQWLRRLLSEPATGVENEESRSASHPLTAGRSATVLRLCFAHYSTVRQNTANMSSMRKAREALSWLRQEKEIRGRGSDA